MHLGQGGHLSTCAEEDRTSFFFPRMLAFYIHREMGYTTPTKKGTGLGTIHPPKRYVLKDKIRGEAISWKKMKGYHYTSAYNIFEFSAVGHTTDCTPTVYHYRF